MKDEWVQHIIRLSRRKADFYSGCRKIITARDLVFHDLWEDKDPLILEDCGYTSAKMSHLKRLYYHEESVEMAIKLWNLRRSKSSYGSVSFTCYNHLLKNDIEKKSKRASVMGPCIQAVSITQIKGNGKAGTGGQYSIDAFYRTTEILKKFPADLVFIRDVLLEGFDFSGMEFMGLTCHFANITVHPQYFVTAIPHLEDPIAELEKIKAKDKYFHDWIIKWSARYLCEEHYRGIAKFAQALRVKMDADKRITGKRRKKLVEYLRENHPGHRNGYVAPEEEEED
jgi:hypothetical protein